MDWWHMDTQYGSGITWSKVKEKGKEEEEEEAVEAITHTEEGSSNDARRQWHEQEMRG